MAVKIRLRRMGQKKAPYYRIVVADARSPRDGRFIEEIGTYDPPTRSPALTAWMKRQLRDGWLTAHSPQKWSARFSNWPAFRSKAAAEVS